MGLTVGTAKPVNLSMGTNTGYQANVAVPGVNQAPNINQMNGTVPAGSGTDAGSQVQGSGSTANVALQAPAPVRPSAAQVDPLMAALASLDTILGNKNNQSHAEYNRAISGYDAQDAIDRGAYNKNVHNNEQSLTSNNQAALLNAANASSGLRGVLSSLGGLAGSGMDVVKRLVGLAANSDTGSARQTFDTNAGNLNTAWSQAEQQQKQRRQDASATLDNNIQNNTAGVLSSRQNIYQQLANLYGDQLPEGNDYASKASALAPEIAATTRASVAPYAAASSSFSPAALQNYLAGTQNLNVDTSGGSSAPINSPVFLAQQKKDQLTGVA